jgi:hypothetical protein
MTFGKGFCCSCSLEQHPDTLSTSIVAAIKYSFQSIFVYILLYLEMSEASIDDSRSLSSSVESTKQKDTQIIADTVNSNVKNNTTVNNNSKNNGNKANSKGGLFVLSRLFSDFLLLLLLHRRALVSINWSASFFDIDGWCSAVDCIGNKFVPQRT